MAALTRTMRFAIGAALVVLAGVAAVADRVQGALPLAPTQSSPIAITSDDQFVWVVNPQNNSVTVHRVAGDANTKLAEIRVGVDPQCVAITPTNAKVYVTNMVSGTVSVIDTATLRQTQLIQVGTEPVGCALTPDGAKLYVANFVVRDRVRHQHRDQHGAEDDCDAGGQQAARDRDRARRQRLRHPLPGRAAARRRGRSTRRKGATTARKGGSRRSRRRPTPSSAPSC